MQSGVDPHADSESRGETQQPGREPLRQKEAGYNRRESQDEASCQQLPHQAQAGRSQRHPQGHLAPSPQRIDQGQVGNIQAGNQENQSDDRQIAVELPLQVGSIGGPDAGLPGGKKFNGKLAVPFFSILVQLCVHSLCDRPGLRDCHVVIEPSDDQEPGHVGVFERIDPMTEPGDSLPMHSDWDPYLGEGSLPVQEVSLETGLCNTHHCEQSVLDLERLSDDRWIGSEAAFPETVANHNHGVRIVFLQEGSAVLGGERAGPRNSWV